MSAATEFVLRESCDALDLRRRSLQMVFRACHGQQWLPYSKVSLRTLQYSLLLRLVSSVR